VGIEKNENKAFEIYKRFHEKDFINRKYKLGICYYFGIGTEINKKESFIICKDLTEKGFDNAQAFPSAENGNIDAMVNLAQRYQYGQGTEKDLVKAFYWYKKAVTNDNIVAMKAADNGDNIRLHYLGEYYELGKKVNKDEIKASEYYKKSAENGLVNAKFYLGYCYINGIETEINKEMVYNLYNEVTGKGDIMCKTLN
ncbi:3694_t:CDS:2, partial [Funneliformis geosporum]